LQPFRISRVEDLARTLTTAMGPMGTEMGATGMGMEVTDCLAETSLILQE